MNKKTNLEILAEQVALLDQNQLLEFARILTNTYPAHTDFLESYIKISWQEIIFEEV